MGYPYSKHQLLGGVQKVFKFPNGYGASVVRHSVSYGSNHGLWELAVLDAASGKLLYDTPITNDVLGRLTESEVETTLNAIAALPKRLTQIKPEAPLKHPRV